MKHAMSAAIALAVGLGFAGAAVAADTTSQNAMPNTTTPSTAAPAQQAQTAQQPTRLTRQDIRQAQQQLQSQGLYKGRIDGVMGRATRQAVAKFQQQNNLPHTARLDQATLDRLTGGQGAGVGSSMPNGANDATPMVPPATQAPGAGGNTNPPNSPDQSGATH